MLIAQSKDELLALHRALFTARLEGPPDQLELATSPVLADMHDRVVRALLALISDSAGASSAEMVQWQQWLSLRDNSFAQELIKQRLGQIRDWDALDSSSKHDVIVQLTKPFVVSEQEIDLFVEYADRK